MTCAADGSAVSSPPASPDPSGRAGTGVGKLLRRADFLRAAKGKRWHGKALTLQAVRRPDAAAGPPRVGLTLTRKVGGAVIRNRARRRRREALRLAPDLSARADHDYVVIGRLDAIRLPFETLKAELARAFIGVHDAGRAARQSDTVPKRKPPVAKPPVATPPVAKPPAAAP